MDAYGKAAAAFCLDTVINGLGPNGMCDPATLLCFIQHAV